MLQYLAIFICIIPNLRLGTTAPISLDTKHLIPLHSPLPTWGVICSGFKRERVELEIQKPTDIVGKLFLQNYTQDISFDEHYLNFTYSLAKTTTTKIHTLLKTYKLNNIPNKIDKGNRKKRWVAVGIVVGTAVISTISSIGLGYMVYQQNREINVLRDEISQIYTKIEKTEQKAMEFEKNIIDGLNIIANITETNEVEGLTLEEQILGIRKSLLTTTSTSIKRMWLSAILEDYYTDLSRAFTFLKLGVIDPSLWTMKSQRKFLENYIGDSCSSRIQSVCPNFDMKVIKVMPKEFKIIIDK